MFSFVNKRNLQYEPNLYNKKMAMRVKLGGFNTKTVSFSFSLFLLFSVQSQSGFGLYWANRGVGQVTDSDLETDRDIAESLTGAG